MNLAPIIFFTYKRPLHTQLSIEALQKNLLAAQSDLIIFSDGPKNNTNIKDVQNVRAYLKTIDGFKSIRIVEQEVNKGLAISIIEGVTSVIKKYGKAIVLEDDLITSPFFLEYMNDALSFYKTDKNVWHISGWNYPINTHNLPSTIAIPIMNCWGWGTWSDKWKYFQKNPSGLYNYFKQHKEKKKNFDIDNTINNWKQVVLNHNNSIDTWAIFWYATIFRNSGICINPTSSFVENIGLDNTGTNCRNSNWLKTTAALKKDYRFFHDPVVNATAMKRIKWFNRLAPLMRYFHEIYKPIINICKKHRKKNHSE